MTVDEFNELRYEGSALLMGFLHQLNESRQFNLSDYGNPYHRTAPALNELCVLVALVEREKMKTPRV